MNHRGQLAGCRRAAGRPPLMIWAIGKNRDGVPEFWISLGASCFPLGKYLAMERSSKSKSAPSMLPANCLKTARLATAKS